MSLLRIRATCPALLTLFDLVIIIILGEQSANDEAPRYAVYVSETGYLIIRRRNIFNSLQVVLSDYKQIHERARCKRYVFVRINFPITDS
jgi:hypothetical protein